MGRKKPRWRLALLAIAAVALGVQVAGTLAVVLYWTATQGTDRTVRYSAVAVLHADVPPSLERTRGALDRVVHMHRAHAAQRIVCIGGNRRRMSFHGGSDMRIYLVSKGIPREHIEVDQESYDTRTNLRALRAALGNQSGKVALIAYPAHQFRIRYLLAIMAPELKVDLVTPDVPNSRRRLVYESWRAVNHEAAAWAATLLLSDALYARLTCRLRGAETPPSHR